MGIGVDARVSLKSTTKGLALDENMYNKSKFSEITKRKLSL